MAKDRRQLALEEAARRAGERAISVMPPGAGCAVLAFDWGDGGFMAYASNAKREDMIRALRELLERFEGGTENTAGRS